MITIVISISITIVISTVITIIISIEITVVVSTGTTSALRVDNDGVDGGSLIASVWPFLSWMTKAYKIQ